MGHRGTHFGRSEPHPVEIARKTLPSGSFAKLSASVRSGFTLRQIHKAEVTETRRCGVQPSRLPASSREQNAAGSPEHCEDRTHM